MEGLGEVPLALVFSMGYMCRSAVTLPLRVTIFEHWLRTVSPSAQREAVGPRAISAPGG